MAVHLFYDNSNILGGAQGVAKQVDGAPWPSVRVYYRNMFALLEGDRQIATRVLAGSVPPDNDSLWEYAEQHGYSTDLLKRVEKDDGKIGEQGVDEALHLKIANALLDFEPPQTLVIASGDGSISDLGTSFPSQIERAVKRGWEVELWAWGMTIKKKRYDELEKTSAGKFQVIALDPHYASVTFIKAGRWYTKKGGAQVWHDVEGRVVAQL